MSEPNRQEMFCQSCGMPVDEANLAVVGLLYHHWQCVYNGEQAQRAYIAGYRKGVAALRVLANIHMAARRGMAFGKGATPQNAGRMVEVRDEALALIVKFCERAGVEPSSALTRRPNNCATPSGKRVPKRSGRAGVATGEE